MKRTLIALTLALVLGLASTGYSDLKVGLSDLGVPQGWADEDYPTISVSLTNPSGKIDFANLGIPAGWADETYSEIPARTTVLAESGAIMSDVSFNGNWAAEFGAPPTWVDW